MKWLFSLIYAFSSAVIFAQIDPFPSKQEGLIWKISGNGLTEDSYVFGTMHMMDAKHYLFPKTLDSLVRQSDELVMELGELPDPIKTLNLMTLKEGSFFDYFTKKETKVIIQWAQFNLNFDEKLFRSMVDKLKPFAVVQLTTQLTFNDETYSYELELYSISKAANLPILGLETVAKQIGFFDQLPKEEQKKMVLSSLQPKEVILAEMGQLQSMYLTENIDSIYLYIQGQEKRSGLSMDKLLDNRNEKWIDALTRKLSENKRLFVAVGAGHLGGTKGLIRSLQEEGYQLTPILLKSLK